MKIEIKRWFDASVLFTAEIPEDTREHLRMKVALELAVGARASLVGASLDGARLDGASLVGASLDGASLVGASLDGASLDGASLVGASLDEVAFKSLERATGVDWTGVRDDFWAVLCSAPKEVEGLRAALAEGRIDGSTYTGECACLVGTIANVRHVDVDDLGDVLKPNSNRPAERFFLGIRKGDTPETNPLAKMALGWTDQWLATMRAAFGEKQAA